jgi:hypothetical protein
MTGTGIPAAELLAAGECTPTCLLAREPNGCACRCGSTWHGALSDVRVPAVPQEKTANTGRREPRLGHGDAVRDFSHARLAALPSYGRIRQALSDLDNEIPDAGGMGLAEWLAAVRDMAVTAPFGDMCNECCRVCARTHQHDADEFPRPCGAYRMWWPSAAERRDKYMRGRYQCDHGHVWGCSWLVSMAALR